MEGCDLDFHSVGSEMEAGNGCVGAAALPTNRKAAVSRIDEVLKEAAEVIKSIQLSRIGSHEHMKQMPSFKPINLYGSKWLQRIEDSSDRLEMVCRLCAKTTQPKTTNSKTPENLSFKRWRKLHNRPSRTWSQPIVSLNSNLFPHLRGT